MAEKLYKFTFKAHTRGMWDTCKVIGIKYKATEVGYMSDTENHNWIILLQLPATQKALEKNPNCPWMWAKIKHVFDTSIEAKNWLNDNRKDLIGMLYYENSEKVD